MTNDVLSQIQSLSGVTLCPGVTLEEIATIGAKFPDGIPREYLALLRFSNGIEVSHGYYRLFGASDSARIDAVSWNELATWKFAWKGRADAFWCFGEEAFGDQYAVPTDRMNLGMFNPVYRLDMLSMESELIASTFDEFLVSVFLEGAKKPQDRMIQAAMDKYGELRPDELLVYVPSVHLTGREEVEAIERMERCSAMTCNGDIAVQLDEMADGAQIAGIEPYVDDAGRSRVKLITAN